MSSVNCSTQYNLNNFRKETSNWKNQMTKPFLHKQNDSQPQNGLRVKNGGTLNKKDTP